MSQKLPRPQTVPVRHIDERHGVQGSTDTSMADDKDLARIQYVLDNYDSVEVLPDLSAEYRTKNQEKAPMIKYTKRVNGSYYVVEAVPDTKRQELPIVSAYKNKAVEQQTVDVQAPTSNVRNASPGTTLSTNNIPQQSGTVKESGTPILQRVEALSIANEAITVEEARQASGYGDYGAKMLVDTVNNTEGATFSMVNNAMRNAYLAGRTGVDGKKVHFVTDLQRDAFTAGKKDAEMNRLIAEEKAGYATVYGEESGFIPNDASKNVSPKMVKALNIVAKDLGIKVMFEDRIVVNERGDEANAEMGDDGIFRISATSSQPLYELIMHEPFHRMRQFATKEYYNALNFAVQHAESLGLRLEQDNSIGTAFEALTNLYEGKGLSHSEAQILDEIGARFFQKIVNGDADAINFINEMNKTEETRTALQKFMDFVKDLIEKLKKVVRRLRNEGEYAAAKELGMTIKELEHIRELYAKAYKATQKAVAEHVAEQKAETQTETTKVQKSTGGDGGVQYSFKESFGEQLEDWRKGNGKAYGSYNGRYFELGTTPEILVKHGAPDGEVIMFEDCLTKIAGLKHSISLDEIARIPTQLNDPILLFKGSHENSFVALTEVKAKNGHDVIVAIHINKRLGRSVINKIASVYSKTDDYGNNKIKNYVMAQISAGNLLDASTKKAPTWFTASGLQLPHAVQTIIDANNSISQTAENSQENFAGGETTTNRQFSLKDDVQTGTGVDGGETFSLKVTDYTLDDVKTIQSVGRKSVNDFEAEDVKKTEKFAQKYWREMGIKSPFFRAWFGDWRANDKTVVDVLNIQQTDQKNPRGQYKNNDTGFTINSSAVGYDETISHSGKDKLSIIAMQNIDKIIEKSILLDTEVSEPGRGKKSIYTCFMHKFYAPVIVDGRPCIAKLTVDESYQPGAKDTNKKFYHVRAIKIEPASSVGIGFNHTPIMDKSGPTITVADLFQLVKQNDKEFAPRESSKIINEDGTPKIMYHQAENVFTIFDTRHDGAGTRDNETPFGIFLKPTSEKIGVKGDVQMPLYANIKNYLEVANRNDLVAILRKMSVEFSHLYDEHIKLDGEYQGRFDEAQKNFRDYIIKWRAENPNASRQAIYDDTGFSRVFDAEETILEEWENNARQLETKTKDVITRVLKENNYDGVHLLEDTGGFGKKTETYIALEPAQVKSETGNIGTFDKNNPDIDYSLKDDVEVSPKKTKELLDTIAYLKDQMKLTKFAKPDPKKLKAMARKFLKEYGSGHDLAEATNAIDDLYRYIANGEDGYSAAWDEVFNRAKKIATEIAEKAIMTDDSDWVAYQDLRNYLRQTKMYIHPSDFDDAAGFRRRNSGRIRLTTKDESALGVDEVFQELSAMYPEFFNEDNAGSGADKLYIMEEVLNSLKPLEFNPFASDMDVPRKTSPNKKVSQTVRTILEAKATPDVALPSIEKMVVDGTFSYDTYTDKQAIHDAEADIQKRGWVEREFGSKKNVRKMQILRTFFLSVKTKERYAACLSLVSCFITKRTATRRTIPIGKRM